MRHVNHYTYDGVRYFRFGYNPIGKPFLFVNVFFVDGLLIDTGQRNMSRSVMKTISSLEVKQIYLTHHHEDHTGNISVLQRRFNCGVYASTKCCELMTNPPPISLAQRMVWGNRPAYHHLIPIIDLLRTPKHTFQLIPIPGHAEDMVALYEPDKKWLFSGDLFINSYIGYCLQNERIMQQITSIRRVLTLPFETMFCSHNLATTEGRSWLEKKLSYLEKFYQDVARLYQKGYSPKEIFNRLDLKEHGGIHLLSHGMLSKMNMVRSVIRDLDKVANTD